MATPEKRLFHAIVLMGAALTATASLAGCGAGAGGSQPIASSDGGYGRIYPDTNTADSGYGRIYPAPDGDYTPILPYDPPDTGIRDGGADAADADVMNPKDCPSTAPSNNANGSGPACGLPDGTVCSYKSCTDGDVVATCSGGIWQLAFSGDPSCPPVDAGDGTFGPCSLASVGHPSAAAVALTQIGPVVMGNGVCVGGGNDLQPVLLQSAQDFDAYEADAGVADAGSLASVNWATQSLLVLQSTTRDALTAGTDGTALVISEGQYCQGTGSGCSTSFYAVPKVATVDVLGCAPPSTPCTAP